MSPQAIAAMKEFEQLKIQEKSIQSRLDELKEIIMPEVEVGKKYVGEQGAFEVKSKAVWKFSEFLNQKKAEMKEAESDEIARGVAINTPSVYIEYRKSK